LFIKIPILLFDNTMVTVFIRLVKTIKSRLYQFLYLDDGGIFNFDIDLMRQPIINAG